MGLFRSVACRSKRIFRARPERLCLKVEGVVFVPFLRDVVAAVMGLQLVSAELRSNAATDKPVLKRETLVHREVAAFCEQRRDFVYGELGVDLGSFGLVSAEGTDCLLRSFVVRLGHLV